MVSKVTNMVAICSSDCWVQANRPTAYISVQVKIKSS